MRHHPIRTLSRMLAVIALSALGMLTAVLPASAHVTVHGDGAEQGGYALLTFRVPTESATASTTKLQVKFPSDTPIQSVSVQPRRGWSVTVTTATLDQPITTRNGSITEATSEITWTADTPDDAIKPGEFDQFLVSAGPLPDVSTLRFPAIQTYSDGTVVSWNETAAAGGTARPEHPAPTLELASSDAVSPAVADSTGSGHGTALTLSIVATVLAAAALGAAGAAWKRRGAASPATAAAVQQS